MNAADRASEQRLIESEAKILAMLQVALSAAAAAVDKAMTQERVRLERRLAIIGERAADLERRLAPDGSTLARTGGRVYSKQESVPGVAK